MSLEVVKLSEFLSSSKVSMIKTQSKYKRGKVRKLWINLLRDIMLKAIVILSTQPEVKRIDLWVTTLLILISYKITIYDKNYLPHPLCSLTWAYLGSVSPLISGWQKVVRSFLLHMWLLSVFPLLKQDHRTVKDFSYMKEHISPFLVVKDPPKPSLLYSV